MLPEVYHAGIRHQGAADLAADDYLAQAALGRVVGGWDARILHELQEAGGGPPQLVQEPPRDGTARLSATMRVRCPILPVIEDFACETRRSQSL